MHGQATEKDPATHVEYLKQHPTPPSSARQPSLGTRPGSARLSGASFTLPEPGESPPHKAHTTNMVIKGTTSASGIRRMAARFAVGLLTGS
jgi:hypothetical protein